MTRKARRNSPEQVRFAEEILEMSGVNLLDGRHIASSIALHRTADMNRVRQRKENRSSIEAFLAGGGVVTKLPDGTA